MSSESSVQLQGWLARLAEGDDEARAELIRRSCARLQKLVHRMLKNFSRVRRFEDTDDVLQNVLVRLMRRLDAARPPTVVDYFRLAAAETRHELIDLTRHYFGPRGAGAREVPQQLAGASNSSMPGGDPSEHTHNPEPLVDWTEFHHHVEHLPAEERDVFAMLWYSELTQADVAMALGVSVPTVKRRWLAARLRLQQWLDGDDAD